MCERNSKVPAYPSPKIGFITKNWIKCFPGQNPVISRGKSGARAAATAHGPGACNPGLACSYARHLKLSAAMVLPWLLRVIADSYEYLCITSSAPAARVTPPGDVAVSAESGEPGWYASRPGARGRPGAPNAGGHRPGVSLGPSASGPQGPSLAASVTRTTQMESGSLRSQRVHKHLSAWFKFWV